MAFRRQDIPKTTRKPKDGGPRRIYPRYLPDRTILPSIELAIGYLDGMIGRRRGELSSDMLLDLFDDPKVARCILSCMSDYFVYRASEIADVTGCEAAAALTKGDICTPAELRGFLYSTANSTRGGFVAGRLAFFEEAGDVLGIAGSQVEQLMYLDAERNAILIRVGPRPRAEDVVARYNVMLTLSVLRHASTITLSLPGISSETVEAVCARHEVPVSSEGSGNFRLAGRRSTAGTWTGFGARLARCALQLLVLCPRTPTGVARVHFGEQLFQFVVDGKSTSALRPRYYAAAEPAGMAATLALADALASYRRECNDLAGWRLHRWPEPIVVDEAVVIPELAFTYGRVTVAALPVASRSESVQCIGALRAVNQARPVVAIGPRGSLEGLPSISDYDPVELGLLLAGIANETNAKPSTLELLDDELADKDWLSLDRLRNAFPGRADPEGAVAPLIAQGARFVPGFGLCNTELIDELQAPLRNGPIDIAEVRRQVSARVGDVPGTDALTLYVLSASGVVSNAVRSGMDRSAA